MQSGGARVKPPLHCRACIGRLHSVVPAAPMAPEGSGR